MRAGYEDIYGLGERAFEAAVDPRFHFPSLTQRKAMSAVSLALNRGAGVVALTGAHGLGKSSLLAHLADQIAGQPVTLAWLAGGFGPLAGRVAEAFGLAPPADAGHALAALAAFLLEESRRGQRALLLLDQCESLAEAAEDLAALATLQHGERSLLQIVLAGEDRFARRLLEDERWAGVRERTVSSHSFDPLLRDEVEPYLRHRLLRAGWEGTPALDPGLAPLLHEATGGVPAAINRAMSVLLDDAAEAGADAIDGDALAAWLNGGTADEEHDVVAVDRAQQTERESASALGEAQIAAIADALAEHNRQLARLRRDLAELRDRPEPAAGPVASAPPDGECRLEGIEARLDQHEQALRQMLERLTVFFERAAAGGG